jgi:uncharacterized damage-inducible protein DinB
MMKTQWFNREFAFGAPIGMLPFHLERLRGTLPRLRFKLNNVPEKILSDQLDGKWSIKQNIGHLSEVEEISIKRINEMINGISPLSPAVFEPTMDYNAMQLESILEMFGKVRLENIRRYDNLSDEDLTKSSLHPRLKVQMNPVDLALFHAEHDDHHLVRITEILHHFQL